MLIFFSLIEQVCLFIVCPASFFLRLEREVECGVCVVREREPPGRERVRVFVHVSLEGGGEGGWERISELCFGSFSVFVIVYE